MGQFSYKAVDQGGGRITGTIDAADRRSAVVALADKGHFVTELAEASQVAKAEQTEEKPASDMLRLPRFGSHRITSKEILGITTQLSTAVRAGLPLLNALELISQQQNKTSTKEMLEELVKAVNSGQSLSEAMAEHEDCFNPLYVSMIRVGETGGILEQTSSQLARILTRDEKIKTNMKNASAYPIFVLALGFISVVIVLTFILPKIIATIEGGVAVLPLPTRILMAVSDYMSALFTTVQGWIVLAVIIAGFYYFKK